MDKWRTMLRDEQETIIRVDYVDATVTLYTSREAVARRFIKAIGEADKVFRVKGEGICGMEWTRSFSESSVLFGKSRIIGGKFKAEVQG